MNIGFLSEALPYLPCREGFRIYGGNLIRTLSRHHRVHLVSLLWPDDERHLEWSRDYCASVSTIAVRSHGPAARLASFISSYVNGTPLHYRPEMDALLRISMDRGRWDVLHVEGPFAGGLLPIDLPIPKVLSVHDSQTLRWHEVARCVHGLSNKAQANIMSRYARRYERLVYPRFDRCVVVAAAEMKALHRIAPRVKVEVIGNGTDTEYFSPQPGGARGMTLVFHGNLGYPPNADAAVDLADNILPLIRCQVPDVVFHLVGADPTPAVRALSSRSGITLSINLPDLRPALATARVYVCPVRHGGGIKNKLLEAMAMQLPVVSYPEATLAIEAVRGTHLLIASGPDEFARQVVDLLRNPQRAGTLAEAGRLLTQERYSWEARAASFERLYENIIEERATRLLSPTVEP